MALVKLSGLISDIRGKIGGTVFQRGQGGLVMHGSARAAIKGGFAISGRTSTAVVTQKGWADLSDAQRRNWSVFANHVKVSQLYNKDLFINGHQLYLKLNFYRIEYGYALLDDPSYLKCFRQPVVLDFTKVASNFWLSSDRFVNANQEFLILSLTYIVSPAVNNPGSRFKMIIFTTTSGKVWDLANEYLNRFGQLPSDGDTVFIKYTNSCLFSGLIFPFVSKKVVL